jgi:hypothetical protein
MHKTISAVGAQDTLPAEHKCNGSAIWIAWSITIGETLLLLGLSFGLTQYWLMLPVWMRSCAALALTLGFLLIAYRFFNHTAKKKRTTASKPV